MATSKPNIASMGSIGVLTSGGDSQGMNCVLFGLVKSAKPYTDVYLIRDGYSGLVRGGPDSIQKADLTYLQKYLHQGGTIIGSSRCPEFRENQGRKQAARNLYDLNIQNLVIIGGDGSLTGANLLQQEWKSHLAQVSSNNVSKLNIVGIIGSIDNDFYGTEMTVGADSALCRVIEAIDILKTTAASHHRVMVIEVMGRNCGYLSLSAALATEATYVFIPECPHKSNQEWQQKLAVKIDFERKNGQYYHIIIVAEGACDIENNRIKPESIRDYLTREFKLDTRVVVLGHTQRGGNVSAFDRLMSIQIGIEAFNVLKMQSNQESNKQDAIVLTFNDCQIRAKSLMSCIHEVNKLIDYVNKRDWKNVAAQRGTHFINTWDNYLELMSPNSNVNCKSYGDSWSVVNLGLPIPGMNAVLYGIVRYGLSQNMSVFGVENGIEGLVENKFLSFTWSSVIGFTSLGGSVIGSSSPKSCDHINEENIESIANNLKQRKVIGLCFLGDNLAYEAAKTLNSYKSKFDILQKIKICFIPATIEPKGDLISIGCKLGYDSLLNKLFNSISDLMLSSVGTHNRLFIIKLYLSMTTNDFYQPSLFALANQAAYIYPRNKALMSSEEINTEQIEQEANFLKSQMLQNHMNQIIFVNKNVFGQVNNIYQYIFNNQKQIKLNLIDLTNIQVPMMPTHYDRKLGVKLGMQCARYFSNENKKITPVVLKTPTFEFVQINP